MASNRDKKVATANTNTLKELHLISLAVNALVLLIIFIFRRPSSVLPFIVFSFPAIFCQYTLEKSGRPKYGKDEYGNPKLITAGDEIKGQGLFEYMFDVIYVTWILDILLIVVGSNKIWWLYSVIPGYAGYTMFGFVKPFLLLGGKKAKTEGAEEEKEKSGGVSKRQAKLKARSEKQQVKYR